MFKKKNLIRILIILAVVLLIIFAVAKKKGWIGKPDEIKVKIATTIAEGSVTKSVPQIGTKFLKFCGKYDLKKISESPQQYVDCLSGQYPAVEQTASILRNTK